MDWIILLKLLFAHIVCDFVLQPVKMVEAKLSSNSAMRTKALLLHAFLHGAMAYLVVAQWVCWYIPVVIFVTHFAIDWWKTSIQRRSIWHFVADQILHLSVIVLLWLVVTGQYEGFGGLFADFFSIRRVWGVAIAYLLMLKPTSLAISLFINRWKPDVKESKMANDKLLTTQESQTLEKAGQYIGYLERTMTLTFILTGNMAAVGFLLAAKSIFRFGDLKPGRNLKLTEYVLIGTFSSFFVAIITGLVVKALL
ncbi:hypothetical protein M2132_000857 [Dysgonomonas sp. PH5-45]|uniref:DUF3307 domain-containing protein n=1 Tax=unclassified Dysgonomonas TaxID=2630389 RepID=UPI002474AD59|nr:MULTISPECIES: DUF3307 domain-containing protein [unclassified Dysgonomonas]MDH6354529.1 hypothetical protein [Dysgonomonas sp. PH5-45]MDH6387415.1 hypothetical protein [Dysgonomonas sp. PH5-37]